ncbi:hypothetical protein BD769DRAFT_1648794 [Suillus cothurnatus]|nr:hypothetical protein BD769DRAFT_1648794 [Suillus cothurnatus]
MAGFSVRNAYYLRVSASSVIPLYLYLDERHVDWMSDTVLQHVLADLRPLVLPKLQAEKDIHFGPGASSGKKGAVDVHRGGAVLLFVKLRIEHIYNSLTETYQAAFFFQKTEPHNVIIKTRSFVPAPPPPSKLNIPPSQLEKSKSRSRKRKGRAADNKDVGTAYGRKSGRRKADLELIVMMKRRRRRRRREEEEVISLSDGDSETDKIQGVSRKTPATTRRSQRTRKVPVGGYREDVEDLSPDEHLDRNEVPAEELSDHDVLVIDHSAEISTTVKQEDTEKREKGQVALKLKYQGFNIFGRCLCVVVEPWPPIRSATRAPSVMPLTNEALRGSTIAPPDFVPSKDNQRARTPLFLPEFDRDRSMTPVPFPRAKTLPPVPLFNDPTTNSDDDGYGSDDLMIFSQALNTAGGMHVAAADDDDEMDGAVLFGDADEVREFS